MDERHASIFTPAVAAMIVLLASPLLAQAPPDPSSSRADLLGDARESLTGQAVPPGRSTVERGLYWYDNQYVLAKLFGGWKGIHLAGGDFPAGAGFKVGVGFDHAIGSADIDPRLPNRVALTARAAYGTRGYTRLSAGVNASNLGGAPVDIGAFGQYLRVRAGRLLRPRDG